MTGMSPEEMRIFAASIFATMPEEAQKLFDTADVLEKLMNPPPPTLFRKGNGKPTIKRARDIQRAIGDREEGMALVDDNADEEWKEHADLCIVLYCKCHPTMFVDDLWDWGLREPKSLRALGPRVRSAAHKGYIYKSGQSKPSVRSRMGEKPIWISTIYDADAADLSKMLVP